VDNLVIRRARYGIAFFMKYGGVFEHARFSNLVMATGSRHATEYPIYLDVDRVTPDLPYGTIQDVTFSGLDVTTRGNLLMAGHPEAPLRDLTLDNVRITVRGAGSNFQIVVSPKGTGPTMQTTRVWIWPECPPT